MEGLESNVLKQEELAKAQFCGFRAFSCYEVAKMSDRGRKYGGKARSSYAKVI